jgi:hypothetical protein
MAKETHIHFHFESAPSVSVPAVSKVNSIVEENNLEAKKKTYVGINKDSYSNLDSIKYSKNGISWANIKSGGFDQGINNVAFGLNKWVAVGNYGEGLSSIQYSTNGSNWSNSASIEIIDSGTSEFTPSVIAYGNNLWVAGGRDYNVLNLFKWSTDGSNWSNIVSNELIPTRPPLNNVPQPESINSIVWNSTINLWVASVRSFSSFQNSNILTLTNPFIQKL